MGDSTDSESKDSAATSKVEELNSKVEAIINRKVEDAVKKVLAQFESGKQDNESITSDDEFKGFSDHFLDFVDRATCHGLPYIFPR